MNIDFNKKILIFITFFVIFSVFDIFGKYTVSLNQFLAILNIALSILLLIKVKKNIPIFITCLFIGYSNFSISMSVYINRNVPESMFQQIKNVNIYGKANLCISIFMLFLILFLPKRTKEKSTLNQYTERNDFLFFFIYILLIVIFFVGYQNQSGARSITTPLYEYSSILFIFLFYFSGKKKIKVYLSILLIILFSLQSVTGGNRVEAITFIFVFIIMTISDKLKIKHILISFSLGIIILNIIGQQRQNLSININTILTSVDNLIQSNFSFNTAYYAFFPSLCSIELKYITSLPSKFYHLIQFIKYIFIGGRINDSNLMIITKEFYYHNNGFVSPIYFYYWIGLLGPVLISKIIIFYFGLLEKYKNIDNDYIALLNIYIICTVPRWYLYGVSPLFRGVLIFTIVYIMFYLIHRIKHS